MYGLQSHWNTLLLKANEKKHHIKVLVQQDLYDVFDEELRTPRKIQKCVQFACIILFFVIVAQPFVTLSITRMNGAQKLFEVYRWWFLVALAICALGYVPLYLAKYTYRRIDKGHFRFVYGKIANKEQTDGRCILEIKYMDEFKDHIVYSLDEQWWSVCQVEDPVYILEIANRDKQYVPKEVFPERFFRLDPDLAEYMNRTESSISGFEI